MLVSVCSRTETVFPFMIAKAHGKISVEVDLKAIVSVDVRCACIYETTWTTQNRCGQFASRKAEIDAKYACIYTSQALCSG